MRRTINQKRLRTWEERGGVFCLLAGLLAPLLGILLTVIEWMFTGAGHSWMHIAATALFIVAIPLILFAGFCLDWAERGQKNKVASAPGITRSVMQPTLSPHDPHTSGVPARAARSWVVAKRTLPIGSR